MAMAMAEQAQLAGLAGNRTFSPRQAMMIIPMTKAAVDNWDDNEPDDDQDHDDDDYNCDDDNGGARRRETGDIERAMWNGCAVVVVASPRLASPRQQSKEKHNYSFAQCHKSVRRQKEQRILYPMPVAALSLSLTLRQKRSLASDNDEFGA